MIGERIGNHRIISKIGQGGMGSVYQAEDTTLGRKVAVKILNPDLLERGGRELERFQAEAKVQASLNHPNIVTLYQFEPYQDSYCMVMEYVEGKTLAEIVRTSGPLPPHIAVNLSKQILDGLTAAHRLGVVHRDLKPSNVMVTPDGVAKVMDFGIAKVQGGKTLTESGALVGTVYYMSPEQVRGEKVDARSDIYSFGIILFELLTGRVPFKEDSDFSIMIHHVQTPPPPPTQFLPEIPTALEDIVLRCLAKDPAARFQSAQEIIAAMDAFEEQERAMGRGQLYSRRFLAEWLAGPGKAAPVTGPGPVPLPSSPPPAAPHLAAAPAKKRGKLPVIAVVAVLLAAAGGMLYLRFHETSAPPEEEAAQQAQPVEAPAGVTTPTPQPEPSPPPAASSTAIVPTPGRTAAQPQQAAPAARETAPSAPVREQLPRGFLIFLELDQGSEQMSLGTAVSQIAQVVRDEGYTTISGGITAGMIRSSLERRELAEVRAAGVGYVVMGTASGSLESQTAYGSTYYVGRVVVNLELVRMSDGGVAATGSGDARSRGTASPQAALDNALMTAVSTAARELMRGFHP